jgi:hypothetical protein
MAQSFDACAAMPRAVASATVRGPLNARIAKETTIPGHHEQRPDFAVDVKPLFRESDRATMRGAFDLWSEDDVLAHGPAIAARLREGTMPCDAPWPKEQVALFERWLGQAGNG